jgi:acetyl esterase
VRDGRRLYSTPLDADRWDGLAPALLAVGDEDPVVDDVVAYAQQLKEAGNEATLRIFPDTPHAAILAPSPVSGSAPSLRHWLGSTLRSRLSSATS